MYWGCLQILQIDVTRKLNFKALETRIFAACFRHYDVDQTSPTHKAPLGKMAIFWPILYRSICEIQTVKITVSQFYYKIFTVFTFFLRSQVGGRGGGVLFFITTSHF